MTINLIRHLDPLLHRLFMRGSLHSYWHLLYNKPFNKTDFRMKKWLALLLISITAVVCATWNNPHHGKSDQNTLYSAFAGAPKTLDPARSYSSEETSIIAQIY